MASGTGKETVTVFFRRNTPPPPFKSLVLGFFFDLDSVMLADDVKERQ
jgi:hypothetical protein